MTDSRRAYLLFFALLLSVLPVSLDAQVRRGRATQEPVLGWVPITIGARIGYDQSTPRGGGTVLGGGAQIPLIRSGHVKLVPNAHVTFVREGRESQYSLEAVFVTGGRRGGLYLGGGIGQRNSTFGFSPTEDSARTYDLVAGITGRFGSRLLSVVEFRYIFMDGFQARPSPVTLGLSFPLWANPTPNGS